MAVATSIDALAVGVSFAFLGIKSCSSILYPAGIIGFVSFFMSLIGLIFGIRFGCGIARKLRAELWGGIILILIGTKILIEHLLFTYYGKENKKKLHLASYPAVGNNLDTSPTK